MAPQEARGEEGALAAAALGLIEAIDIVARETLLFAGIGFLVGGIDDLVIDLLYGALMLKRRWTGSAPALPPPPPARAPMAIFVPAWDEAGVIGPMLRAALARIDHGDYRLYVGTYPNDRATIRAVVAVAAEDARVRLVIGSRDGPTTKADCLNTLWRALLRDEARGWCPRAIVLHDAEDVVHHDELALFDRLIGPYDAVQLPVLPLIDAGARLVSGHYADEFAEAHAKQLVVRGAIGAGLPLAGVGCAIARPLLRTIAAGRPDGPFDAASLTEDYELGLAIAAAGGRTAFPRVAASAGGIVAVRAYFPSRIDAAVRQKARWMTGIALAGWDRIGWM